MAYSREERKELWKVSYINNDKIEHTIIGLKYIKDEIRGVLKDMIEISILRGSGLSFDVFCKLLIEVSEIGRQIFVKGIDVNPITVNKRGRKKKNTEEKAAIDVWKEVYVDCFEHHTTILRKREITEMLLPLNNFGISYKIFSACNIISETEVDLNKVQFTESPIRCVPEGIAAPRMYRKLEQQNQ